MCRDGIDQAMTWLLELEALDFELHELVDNVAELMAIRAQAKGLELACHIAPDVPTHLVGDPHRLRQVLTNLMGNAIKFTAQGGVVLHVTNEPDAPVAGRLRFAVSDTGIGIPPDKASAIFESFMQADASITRQYGGTGLGLTISKKLVELMGGAIGVESAVGQGSTFWVELVQVVGPVARYEQRPDGSAPSAPDAPRRTRTLLYVEDNLSNLELVQRILSRRPEVKLLVAMQGRLGLDLASQHRPDLILLDLHLPDMRGEEVLRRLRATPETQRIPVVVISADATQGQIERLRAAGAQAYLTKPLDVKRLLTILDETLTGPPQAESGSTGGARTHP
jgi:CheY-like chemotaxis protein